MKYGWSAIDILILSNGPGEVTTWVKPVVRSLRQQFGEDRERVRISVVLSPCANASGREAAIVQRYPEVDRVQAAVDFFPFLLGGKTVKDWDWRSRGVVLFLGGDQFFPVVIGKRLGYRIVVYAEWEARWHRWVDAFGVMRPEIAAKAAPKQAHKFTIVGDLMAEAQSDIACPKPDAPLIGILPGSKPAKLSLGVPLMLAIAQQVHQARPDIRWVIPVAPTLAVSDLAPYGDPAQNSVIEQFGWAAAELVTGAINQPASLKTATGLRVELRPEFPAYDLLSRCTLCLTTVGANTAELGALAVPMIVILPTQQLDVMRAWDGLPGILANLPGVGSSLAKVINWWTLQRIGLLAWPNIWAQEMIVPELVGRLEPEVVAAQMLELLKHPDRLQTMRDRLRQVRGEPGAAHKLVQLVQQQLTLDSVG